MKTIIVMPAYNAEKTLEKTLADLPHGVADEIILVDDASTDRTVEIARRHGLTVIGHTTNRGYGANQKTCYKTALAHGADIVVMLHPDYQYDPRVIPHMIGIVQLGICDLVLGNRIRTRVEALSGGMPIYKYLGNRFLTFVSNIILGQNLGEFHSGLRAFTRRVLETIPFELNSDDFVFDQQFLFQAAVLGLRLGDIPVPTRYFPEASSIKWWPSLKYGLETLYWLFRGILHHYRIVPCQLYVPSCRVE